MFSQASVILSTGGGFKRYFTIQMFVRRGLHQMHIQMIESGIFVRGRRGMAGGA